MERRFAWRIFALLVLVHFLLLQKTSAGDVVEGRFSVTRHSDSLTTSSHRGLLLRCISACVAAGQDQCGHGGVDGAGHCTWRPASLTLPSGLLVAFSSMAIPDPAMTTAASETRPATCTQAANDYTLASSGCQCFFNSTRTDCACCRPGGCQCFTPKHYACVCCDENHMCASM